MSDPNGKQAVAVAVALGAVEVYGWLSTGADGYNAYNANKYPAGFSPLERNVADAQFTYDIATVGVSGGFSKLGWKAVGTFMGMFQAVQDVYSSTPSTVQYYTAQLTSLRSMFQQTLSQLQSSQGASGGSQTYTTPSGAVFNAKGQLISAPPKQK